MGFLKDIARAHIYKGKKPGSGKEYVLHPFENMRGEHKGLYEILRTIEPGKKRSSHVNRHQLAELFAHNIFEDFNIRLRMKSERGDYPDAAPGLHPRREDIEPGSEFDRLVNSIDTQHPITTGLLYALRTISVAPSQKRVSSVLVPPHSLTTKVHESVAYTGDEEAIKKKIVDDARELEGAVAQLKPAEKEAVIKVRVGQGAFREGLIYRFGGRCCLSRIADVRLLIASHIKPWSMCDTTESAKTDLENGLLFAINWDAVFDKGLVTFDSSWKIVISGCLSRDDFIRLGLSEEVMLPANYRTLQRQAYLDFHRSHVFRP